MPVPLKITILTVIFFTGSFFYLQAKENKSIAVAEFINVGQSEKTINLVISKSIINFLSSIPGIKTSLLSDTEKEVIKEYFQAPDVIDINKVLDTDQRFNQIIFGNYYVDKKNNTIVIKAYVYDRASSKYLLQNKYEGSINIDIFKTIDMMINDIGSLIIGKNVKIGKVDAAIESGNRKYRLYINDIFQKEIDKSEGYSAIIAAGENIKISLRFLENGKEKDAYSEIISVKEDEIFHVSYIPSGSILIKTIPRANVSLNDALIGETDTIGELRLNRVNSEISNTIRIEKDNKEIWKKIIKIEEGERYQMTFIAGQENIIKTDIFKDGNKNIVDYIPKKEDKAVSFPIRFLEGGLGGCFGIDYKTTDFLRFSLFGGGVFISKHFIPTAGADISFSLLRFKDVGLWLSGGGFCYFSRHFIASPVLKLEIDWAGFFIENGLRYSIMTDGSLYIMIGIGYKLYL